MLKPDKRPMTLADETDAIRKVSEAMADFDTMESARIFSFILERKKQREQIDAVKDFVTKIGGDSCQCPTCVARRAGEEKPPNIN